MKRRAGIDWAMVAAWSYIGLTAIVAAIVLWAAYG